MLGSNELVPSSNSVFNNRTTTYTFSGDTSNTKLELKIIGSKTQTYNKVKKIKLSTAELQEYQGAFYSPELDTKYILSIKDSTLQIKIPRNDEIQISPFIKDVFTDDLTIRFSRNKKNIIDGFFLSVGRVRNLYFSKMPTK
jgi:hypothetical protein